MPSHAVAPAPSAGRQWALTQHSAAAALRTSPGPLALSLPPEILRHRKSSKLTIVSLKSELQAMQAGRWLVGLGGHSNGERLSGARKMRVGWHQDLQRQEQRFADQIRHGHFCHKPAQPAGPAQAVAGRCHAPPSTRAQLRSILRMRKQTAVCWSDRGGAVPPAHAASAPAACPPHQSS